MRKRRWVESKSGCGELESYRVPIVDQVSDVDRPKPTSQIVANAALIRGTRTAVTNFSGHGVIADGRIIEVASVRRRRRSVRRIALRKLFRSSQLVKNVVRLPLPGIHLLIHQRHDPGERRRGGRCT